MNFMNYPKVILFDLDGVILNTEYLYLNLMLEYNKRMNLPISKKCYISNLLGKTRDDITDYFKKKFKNNFSDEDYWNGLIKYREQYLEKNPIELKIGAISLLKYLKENNCFLGIVTSNSITLVKKLLIKAGINIGDFEVIVTREDVSRTKPYPDLYLKAIEQFKISKKDVIAIEDSNVGIKSALDAGIKVINVEDIDIVDEKLKKKCFKVEKTLNDVIKFLKEMRNEI